MSTSPVSPKEVSTVQRWMALDLWMAIGRAPQDFETHIEQYGWADTWSELLAVVRS